MLTDNILPVTIGQVWKSCKWHLCAKKRDQKKQLWSILRRGQKRRKRKGVDDQKDRLKLLLKSRLLFLYSQQDRPANVTSRNHSVVKLQSADFYFPFKRQVKLFLYYYIASAAGSQMVNLLRHKTFTLICLLWLEGLELSQVNLSGLSSSLWLTFEKVEGSQASTSQQSQQFPTTHTGTQRKAQLLRVHLPLFSNPVTHYSPQNKRQQHSSPQHTKSITIA